jgi:hypothetical protein
MKKTTFWSEGAYNDGIGETVDVEFDMTGSRHNWQRPVPLYVSQVSLINGCARNDDLWQRNGRVKELEVSFNGRFVKKVEVADVKAPQKLDLGKNVFVLGQKNHLTFKIADVYPGLEFNDTCIADMRFDGGGTMH